MQERFMKLAIIEAKKAFKCGEVPVGAVIVKAGQVISRAFNKRENNQNSLCHAEILAIDKACKKLKTAHLYGCEMYVTLEPCPMCAGGISASRLECVHFATSDEKYGCAGSVYNLLQDKRLETIVNADKGILGNESKTLLQDFFALARKRNNLRLMIGKEIDEIYAKNVVEDDCEKRHQNKQLSQFFSKKFLNFIAKSKFEIKKQKDYCSLTLSKGRIVAIVQEIGGFGSLLVESEVDIPLIEIERTLEMAFRHKIFVKNGVEIFDKFKG